MQPVRSLWLNGAELWAADAATLAPAMDANLIHLAAAPFTPSLDLGLGDLTEATFVGSAAKAVGLGAQLVGIDTADGELTLTFIEPVGGWRWECTSTPGAPETIYGVYLTNDDDSTLYAAALLPTPVTITSIGDFVSVGELTLKFSAASPS